MPSSTRTVREEWQSWTFRFWKKNRWEMDWKSPNRFDNWGMNAHLVPMGFASRSRLNDWRRDGKRSNICQVLLPELRKENATDFTQAPEQERFVSSPFCSYWYFKLVHAHNLWRRSQRRKKLRTQESKGLNTGRIEVSKRKEARHPDPRWRNYSWMRGTFA